MAFCGSVRDVPSLGEVKALIPNMMYLPRVQANTQIKSGSLKPREDRFKENSRKR